MAKKILSGFICDNCEYQCAKWMGKCPKCYSWNTFTQKIKESHEGNSATIKMGYRSIPEISKDSYDRLISGEDEFDRALGGGFVPGSLTLLAGDPGVGKSTLLTIVLGSFCKNYEKKILYISGEETLSQVADRVNRLNQESSHFHVIHESKWQTIHHNIKELRPKLIVIDSIQTIYSTEVQGYAGSTAQVKEVTFSIMEFSKASQIPVVVIGHITKDGAIAGPKLLEHMVDTVFYFEWDRQQDLRILRPTKNRFGSTDELGIYSMSTKGMKPFNNHLNSILEKNKFEDCSKNYGVSLGLVMKSNRPIISEVQVLVLNGQQVTGKRIVQGIDPARINILLAVMEKFLNVKLNNFDIYINIIGPLGKDEKSLDLAIVVSIYSAYKKQNLKSKYFLVGEVGLDGKVIQREIGTSILKDVKNKILKISQIMKVPDFFNI